MTARSRFDIVMQVRMQFGFRVQCTGLAFKARKKVSNVLAFLCSPERFGNSPYDYHTKTYLFYST